MTVGYWHFPTVSHYYPEGRFNMANPDLLTMSAVSGWTAAPVFVVREFNRG